MASPSTSAPPCRFDPAKGKAVISTFIEGLDVKELTWAWAVVTDCIHVIGHHSTPPDGLRRAYVMETWMDWYGSYLFAGDAQHSVHGLAKELRDACPEELRDALRRTVEDALRACDTRTPQEKAAARAARTVRAVDVVLPEPAPRNPFTVLAGGKS